MRELWMKFWVALGYSQNDIRAQGYDFDLVGEPDTFEYLIGKTGYVQFTPADPEEGRKYADKLWFTPAQASAYTKAQQAVQAVTVESGASDDPLDAFIIGK